MSQLSSEQPQALAWSACRCCGLLQPLPSPVRGHERICHRCHTPFGSGVVALESGLAFAASALFLFCLAQFFPLMGIEMEGLSHSARIFSGVSGLADHDYSSLAVLVFAVAIAAPLWRIFAMIWVLACLHWQRKPDNLIAIFRISEQLRPWSMLDVCLLGAFVASTKLEHLAHIDIGIGFWALGLVVLARVGMDASFDRRAIWDLLSPPALFSSAPDPQTWVCCDACGLLERNADGARRCSRCGTTLHHRKPASLSRTWALVIAGFILYIPANLYPVMTVVSFGREQPATIMGGVRQLLDANDWLLALIVFSASIIIPMLKLLGFIWLMVSVHQRSRANLRDRTRLYRLIGFIGRWSNVDIFVAALLTGLVTLGNIATVDPGDGAMAFAAVVLLTMFAAECFDPRLMWDAAGEHHYG